MINQYTIHNKNLKVTINRKGAELCSVVDPQGFEYMWQAEKVWPRHAPNLFPIVGTLVDHQYIYEGKTYFMTHHGFARDLDFDMLHQSENSIAFVLTHSPSTLQTFPFMFKFLVTYTLTENSLEQRFRVINSDTKDIPISFGGHPAFNANPITEYTVVFSSLETAMSNVLNGPLIGDQEIDAIQGDTIRLDDHTFDQDALIFRNLKSKVVSLVHRKSGHKVTLDVSEFPYLGIWAKPSAPFVCLEPWQGLADFETHNKDIWAKQGIVRLKVDTECVKKFSMQFENPKD